LAQRLYDIAALEPLVRQGFTLLTPNQRLARRIKAQWDAQRASAGERTWVPVQVQPLEPWLLGRWELAVRRNLLPPATLIGAAHMLELWRQVIRAQQLQSAEYHLLLPAAAADIAHQARETLHRWQVDPGEARIRQLFSLDRDCDTFRQWLRAFETRLQRAGLCTPVDCLAQLPAVAGQLPPARVALVEVDEVPPLLSAALRAACTEVDRIAPVTDAARGLIHPFSDRRAELQAVAAWAAGLHRANPDTTVGIVPADIARDRVTLEYLLRREFHCLGEGYNSLPVNFSIGLALCHTPLVRDALATLAMGLSHTSVTAVAGLLHSRFLDLQDSHTAATQRFLQLLYAAGRETVSIAELVAVARRIDAQGQGAVKLGRYLRSLSDDRELQRAAKPSAWATRFRRLLAAWGWPGRQVPDSVEYQQWELWESTLDEFRAFDAVCGAIPYDEALAVLRDCCARQMSHPQTADSPIQVLGPLEAAGLAFDHLWLCGMQAASWPASPRPNPFIPIALQSSLGMPHANPGRELAFCTALLDRYLRSSQTLHASYCRLVDGVPDAPSSLLRDFVTVEIAAPSSVPAEWAALGATAVLEQLADHRAPPLDAARQSAVGGGSRVLEDQSHCPFRAFARHRLHVPSPATASAALSATERGSVLHAALHELWGALGNRATLSAMDTDARERLLAQAAGAALASVPGRLRHSVGAGYWRLEQQRLTALLREWLAVEEQRGEFSVVAREQASSVDLAGLSLELRVDRIDELPDGSRVIIDYKSGHCSVRDWLGERPDKPQLPLYAIAQPGTSTALAFARVQPRDCGYVGLGRIAAADGIQTDIARAVPDGMAAGDWDTLRERWREMLERLARAFAEGEAQVDPLAPTDCAFCGLQPLCRIAGTQVATDGDTP